MSAQSTPAPAVLKDIPSLVGYRVGDDGSVWSCRRLAGRGPGRGTKCILGPVWRQMAVRSDPAGYQTASLQAGPLGSGKSYPFLVHRLVLLAFVGEPPPGHVCCHADGDRSNNRLTNLRWDTAAENLQDEIRHGTIARGSRNSKAKLDESRVAEAKRLLRAGVPRREIRARIGASKTQLKLIAQGRTWRHVP
jgi:hypothetical protein